MNINYHTHYLFSFIVIASGLVACTSTGGRMDAVADAYADILRYRDAHVRSDTMTVRAGVDSVLASHSLTRDEFLAGFHRLADDPATVQPFFDQIQTRLAQTSSVPSDTSTVANQ